MASPNKNPTCFWFLLFWGGIVVAFFTLNELFGPVSLLDEIREKWDLLGEKARERRGS